MIPLGINKRVVESLIKAGAFDSLPGSRRQKLMMHASMIDAAARERKDTLSGQMSLFDMPQEGKSLEAKDDFPDIQDFTGEEILTFEKETLGIYISGHPLEAYRQILDKNVTATSADFIMEDEAEGDDPGDEGPVKASSFEDGQMAVIGGIIADKALKTTRSNSIMAFLTVEDMYGTVEVIVFPRDLEADRSAFEIDRKVLIRGRISTEDERGSKLLFSEMADLDSVGLRLWIRFPTGKEWEKKQQEIMVILSCYDGNDQVVIYTEDDKKMKVLPNSKSTDARSRELIGRLIAVCGEDSVKTTAQTVQWKKR